MEVSLQSYARESKLSSVENTQMPQKYTQEITESLDPQSEPSRSHFEVGWHRTSHDQPLSR